MSLADILGTAPDDEQEDEQPQKRTRRRGKYTPAEREHIRRERNRMHAKRTRDRKKLFLEVVVLVTLLEKTADPHSNAYSVRFLRQESEQTIRRMEDQNARLRDFLTRHGMMEGEHVPIPPKTSIDILCDVEKRLQAEGFNDVDQFDDVDAGDESEEENRSETSDCSGDADASASAEDHCDDAAESVVAISM